MTCAAVALSVAACGQLFGIEEANEIADPRDGGADVGPDTARPAPDGAPDARTSVVVRSGPSVLAFVVPDTRPSQRLRVASTINDGRLTSWVVGGEDPGIGTAKVVDIGDGLGTAIWGRWVNGTTQGTFSAFAPVLTLETKKGLHYAVGAIPARPLPNTGYVPFRYVGGTRVTSDDGSLEPGTVTQGSAAVDFKGELTRVGFQVNFEIGGSKYVVAMVDDLKDVSGSSLGVQLGYLLRELTGLGLKRPVAAKLDGPSPHLCYAANGFVCAADVSGFISGEDFDRLAIVFQVRGPDGAGGSKPFFSAVAVFERAN